MNNTILKIKSTGTKTADISRLLLHNNCEHVRKMKYYRSYVDAGEVCVTILCMLQPYVSSLITFIGSYGLALGVLEVC